MLLFLSHGRRRAVVEGISRIISESVLGQEIMHVWVVAHQLPCAEHSGQPCRRSETREARQPGRHLGRVQENARTRTRLPGVWLRGSETHSQGYHPDDRHFCDFTAIKKFMFTSYKQDRNQSKVSTCLQRSSHAAGGLHL